MNSYRCIDRREVGESAWDRFADQSDEAWLYHRYHYLEALETWRYRQDASFAVTDDAQNNQIVAIIPADVSKEFFLKILSRKRIELVGGVALRNDLSPFQRSSIANYILGQLWRRAKIYQADQISFLNSILAPAYRGEPKPPGNPLEVWGCKTMLASTWMVNIQREHEEIWKCLEGRARTAIRKAEKSGVVVREADLPTDIDLYYRLHQETYHRTGVRPHPRSYFEKIWEKFLKKGLARILLAEQDREIIAAGNFSIYKNAADYWTGASSQQGLSTGANSLIQWTAMKWMADHQIQWYNCGEAFPHVKQGKLKGLNDYKKSFGGELTSFYKGYLVSGLRAKIIQRYLDFRQV